MTSNNLTFVDFMCVEAYDASALNCYAFRRGTDVRNGITLSLGNMVSGYPFMLGDVEFKTSECAYIAGSFSDGSNYHSFLQQRLVSCTNGFLAKKAIGKPNAKYKRADWDSFKVEFMRYVVWSKCVGNADFRKLLLSIPTNAVIIEDSTFQTGETATLWGTRNATLRRMLLNQGRMLALQGVVKTAIKRELDMLRLGRWSRVGVYRGCNVMGKILMDCRDALIRGGEPLIDYDLLRSKRISILGKVLTFDTVLAA